MARPVFLSYRWANLGEADELDAQLRLRGVPVWRDRRDMRRSADLGERVEAAIEKDCSGFEFVCSREAVTSRGAGDVIHERELPAMDRRADADKSFFCGATFLRIPVSEATTALEATPAARLKTTLGTEVREGEVGTKLRIAAAEITASYLEALPAGPLAIEVNTYGPLPWSRSSDLQLSWRPTGKRAKDLDAEPTWHERWLDRLRIKRSDQHRAVLPRDPWCDDLQPALTDLHEALEAQNKTPRLTISGKMHLSAALVLGYEFRQPSGWTLELDHEFVPAETAKVAGNDHGWSSLRESGTPGRDLPLVVRVDATHDTAPAVARHRTGLAAAGTLRIVPPGGPSNESVRADEANAVARWIAESIVEARHDLGAPETHLYLAGPWSLAVLLGWHLGSSGCVVMHEATRDRNNYRASTRLAF